MSEFPLLPLPPSGRESPPRGRGFRPTTPRLTPGRQGQRLGPRFDRLQSLLAAEPDGLSLRSDPTSIAPERALVLEVAGSIADFHALVRTVDGLEFLADEEIAIQPDNDFHELDSRKDREGQPRTDRLIAGRLYIAMPDVGALTELVSLWRRWQRGDPVLAPWRDIFSSLRDLRPWGPADRIPEETARYWREEVEADPGGVRRIEAELWYYHSEDRRDAAYHQLEEAVLHADGTIVDHVVIEEIGYEAALIDLPANQIERLLDGHRIHLAVCDDVMFLRPQSSVDTLAPLEQPQRAPLPPLDPPLDLPPIAALLDGIPLQNHRLLDGRLEIDDADDLDPMSVLEERAHGTAMASLILHGDGNRQEPPLRRRIHVRPVLYAPGNGHEEQPRQDRLLVDVVFRAVKRMKEGEGEESATAPQVFLVNLSLGDPRRPFSGPMSPWAKLLDYLADRYGLLFLVSAGNIRSPLRLEEFPDWSSFEDAAPEQRERGMLRALSEQKTYRTLLSPAEALNVLTVGALHEDAVDGPRGAYALDPYRDGHLPNMSSAQGLGHRKVVKPDIHLPGGREYVQFQAIGKSLSVVPGGRYGLQAAAPGVGGNLDSMRLVSGTSAATALATRAAHRLFDALMDSSGGSMHADMDPQFYGVVIKALLVHRARWGTSWELLNELYGPRGQGKHVERLDNIARLLGYGFPDVEEANSCTPNRACLVGYGIIEAGSASVHRIPLPPSLDAVTEPRAVTVTVAWLSPVNRRHRAYRQAKLEVGPVTPFDRAVGVRRSSDQPSDKSVPRGTLFHTRYEGDEAVRFIDDGHVFLRIVCREQAGSLDQGVRYGVAFTIEAGEHIPVYQEVRAALAVGVRVP